MIGMREGRDGIFRADGDDRPLPYGLQEDPQEPYVKIVAPNIDKISALSFDGRTVAGRRSRRGLIAFAVSVAGCAIVIAIAVAAQSLMTALGVE